MTERNLASQFIFQDTYSLGLPDSQRAGLNEIARRLAYLNNDTVPGAKFDVEVMWLLPGATSVPGPWAESYSKPHSHPYPEMIAFFGSNLDDMHDLCGEIELWTAGEQHIVNRSFAAIIPAGVEHCPLIIRRIDRPVIQFPGERKQQRDRLLPNRGPSKEAVPCVQIQLTGEEYGKRVQGSTR
jgi:hypothetical protein